VKVCLQSARAFQTPLSGRGFTTSSVTRLDAKILALREWVKGRCKALTLPHRLACVAFTIRACSRLTFQYALFHLIADQISLLDGEDLFEFLELPSTVRQAVGVDRLSHLLPVNR
jgi:hypothetical protein